MAAKTRTLRTFCGVRGCKWYSIMIGRGHGGKSRDQLLDEQLRTHLAEAHHDAPDNEHVRDFQRADQVRKRRRNVMLNPYDPLYKD